MHPLVVAQVLALLLLANSAPVVAKKLLGDRWAWPLDFGIVLPDGRRLFGASKTIRGVVLAVLFGCAGAPLIGLAPGLGTQVALLAMVGDLLSSFLKRRLSLPPSSQAIGIDQIPESLLPQFACIGPLGLTATDIAASVVIFFVGELLLSRLLFRMRLRDQPY
jgi:CDP-2,3-bis-(O-geranylgeranyl)-sn-glycerol synthase